MEYNDNSKQERERLKQRFIDDYKIPIPVIDDRAWDYYLKFYSDSTFMARTRWEDLLYLIRRKFKGNISDFLDNFYKIRDILISSIKCSKAYQMFNNQSDKIEKYKIINPKLRDISGKDIYNDSKVNKSFISLDLMSANVQALNHMSLEFFGNQVINSIETPKMIYRKWIYNILKENNLADITEYFAGSKYLRQVIFGNCNPSRQIIIEKYLIGEAGLWIFENTIKNIDPDAEIIVYAADEMIISTSSKDTIKQKTIIKAAKEYADKMGVYVVPEIFTLRQLVFQTASEHLIKVYKKELQSGKVEYKGIPRNFAAQIYEHINGIQEDPEGRDLMFYQEKELSKFIDRIKFIKS